MKKFSVLLVVVMLATLIIGCAGPAPAPAPADQQPAATTGGQPAAGAPTATPVPQAIAAAQAPASTPVAGGCNVPAPASPTTINLIGWTFPIMDFYAEEFKKCNDVKNLTVGVKLLDGPSAQQQVRLALSGGGKSPYAIVHGANDQVVEWGSAGWIRPINDLVEKYWDQYDLGDIPQAAWAGATIDGKIYGVPVVANTLLLLYRPDLLEKYGLKVPTTYDEVIAACKVLKNEPSIDLPFTINLHAGWTWDYEFLAFIRSFGGDYLNADNTPAFNSPEGVAALTKMKEVIDGCMGPEGLSWSIDQTETGMATGRLAMAHTWASRAANMDNPERSDFVGKIDFAPAAAPKPGGKLGGSAWNDYYMIPATTDVDPDLIFRTIMEATDLESQMKAADKGMTTRTEVGKAGGGGRYLQAANESIAKGVGIYPKVPANSLVLTALEKWLPLVATGELSPKEALNKAAEDYTKEAIAQGYIK